MNIKMKKTKKTGTYDLGVAMTSAMASHLSSDAKALLSGGKAPLEMEEEEAPTRRSNSGPSALAMVPVLGGTHVPRVTGTHVPRVTCTGTRAPSGGAGERYQCYNQLSCGAFELSCGTDILSCSHLLSCSDLGSSPFSPGAKRGRGDMCNNMDNDMCNNMDNDMCNNMDNDMCNNMDNMAANVCGPCSNTRASGSSNARAAARFVEASAAAGDSPGSKTQGSKSGSKTSACTSGRTSKVGHVIQAFQARIRMKNTRLNHNTSNTRLNHNTLVNTGYQSSGAEEDMRQQDMRAEHMSQQDMSADMREQGALDHQQSRADDDDGGAGGDQHEQYECRPTSARGGGAHSGRGCGASILKSTVYRDFI